MSGGGVGGYPTELLLIVAIPAAVGLLALVDVMVRRPAVAAALVLVAAVVEEALGTLVKVGAVSPDDVVAGLLIAAATARFVRMREYSLRQRLLIAIAVVLAFSFMRGLASFGPSAALEVRPFLKFYAAVAYFATVRPPPQLLQRMGNLWLLAAGAICVLSALRWLAALTGISLGPLDPTHVSSRYVLKAVPGPSSFVVGQAFVIALVAAATNRRLRHYAALAATFGAFVLLLNRRTVWVAVAAGLIVLAVRSGRLRRRFAAPLTAAGVVAIGMLFFLSGQTAVLELEEDLAASATDTGTLEGRMEGWQDLLAEGGPNGLEWAVGQPFGTGYVREISGIEVSSNPHNYYVQTTLRLGGLGLLFLLALYLSAANVQRRLPSSRVLLSSQTLIALLVMQLVFFAAWESSIEQGMILGLASAVFVMRPKTAPQRVFAPEPALRPLGAGVT